MVKVELELITMRAGLISNNSRIFQKNHMKIYNASNITNQIIDSVIDLNNQLIMIPIGSNISGCNILKHRYQGEIKQLSFNKKQIIPTAFNF